MKKNDYKQISKRAKENESCLICSLRKKCPYEFREDCMEFNSPVLKTEIK